MNQKNKIVYVVDPDESIGKALLVLLGNYGIKVEMFATAENFLSAYPIASLVDGCVLVADKQLGMSGLSLLQQLHTQSGALPVILLSNTTSSVLRRQVMQQGGIEVIETPLMHSFLIQRISEVVPQAAHILKHCDSEIVLRNGTRLNIRVMHPDDAKIEQEFVRGLSPLSKRMRFFSNITELSPKLLEYFTHPLYPINYALIATIDVAGHERQIAVARYAPTEEVGVAEFAVVVADEWQHFGIASRLMSGIVTAAVIAGVECLEGVVIANNKPMLSLAQKLGFVVSRIVDDSTVLRVTKKLRGGEC